MFEIPVPVHRRWYRQLMGREFFILRRKLLWYRSRKIWSDQRGELCPAFLKFQHRSVVLRPLPGVDPTLQLNKRRNLELATARIDQIVIQPGETFSFWKLVGRPTRRKGYLKGLVLRHGLISEGIGGGLCQLGNLLFWMAAHSPLTITERWRHGYDVFPDLNRSVPFGAGATLAYNYIDFQITNNTPYRFSFRLWLDSSFLNGSLYCDFDYQSTFSVEERFHEIKQQIWGGYSRHNQIHRIEHDQHGVISEHMLVENHALMMYEPLLPPS